MRTEERAIDFSKRLRAVSNMAILKKRSLDRNKASYSVSEEVAEIRRRANADRKDLARCRRGDGPKYTGGEKRESEGGVEKCDREQ